MPTLARKRAALPPGKHERVGEPDTADLPASHHTDFRPFSVDTAGSWLVMGDVHCPYHDRPTIAAAVKEGKRRGIVGVILNGDVMDSAEISRHDKDPSAPRYVEEVKVTRQFLAYIRAQFPKADVIYKDGNHEDRLPRYIFNNSPALFGLECLTLRSLLDLDGLGVAWVTDQRTIALGKLPVIHGHEYGKGGGGAHPSKWLFNKAHASALCGHLHRTDEFGVTDVKGRQIRTWSVGCACDLKPRWLRNNNWGHGCAFVDVANDGTYSVSNLRMFNGKLL